MTELIQSEFDDPVLSDSLDVWRGELERVMARRQDSFDRATRTSPARWRIIHEEVMREYQPIVDYLAGKIIEIENLRPPSMIVVKQAAEEA